MSIKLKPVTLAISLVIFSATMAGCSSDNDDNNNTNPGGDSSAPDTTDGNSNNDGDSTPPGPRFIVSEKGTEAATKGTILLDNDTDLIWVNGDASNAQSGCLVPSDVATLSGISGPTSGLSASEACKNLDFAGFTSWRAPTQLELQKVIKDTDEDPDVSLFYRNPTCPVVAASDGFVRTENVPANGPTGELLDESARSGVRCVLDRFEVVTDANEDTILIDHVKNLTWVNGDASGSKPGCFTPPDVKATTGTEGPVTPESAQAACESLTFGGIDNWRAPTQKEASELIIDTDANASVKLFYRIPTCPIVAASDGFVRTENVPENGPTGELLESAAQSGVRCVADN